MLNVQGWRLCVASTFFLKISAMDLSAQKTMKSAANCDKQCELQIFEKHQNLERALRFRVTLVSNSASVSSHSTAATGLPRQTFGVALDEESVSGPSGFDSIASSRSANQGARSLYYLLYVGSTLRACFDSLSFLLSHDLKSGWQTC